ncbi:MAG: aminodeoxychorismate synthase component I [Planctomycetota bacterium]
MFSGPDNLTATIRVHPTTWRADPAAVFEALARRPRPAWLESSAGDDRWGRYTIAGCNPLWRVTLRDGIPSGAPPPAVAAPAELPDAAPIVWPDGRGESLRAFLRRLLTAVRAERHPAAGYAPGWMGYLGYELGRHFERLPGRTRRDTCLPDMHLGFYDAVAIHDRRDRTWRIAALDFDTPPAGAGTAARELAECLTAAETAAPAPAPAVTPADLEAAVADPQLTGTFAPDAYRRAVARCVEYIAAGDIFQVNLSQRLTMRMSVDPPSVYRCLRRANPAWYSGFVGGDGWAVASSSPELFLRCRGGHIITRPIKGTARRRGDEAADAEAASHLLASAKDNAELAMIIDLLRNDLGRVCRYGSVRVAERRALEAHPTVFHLVGTVEGKLRPECDLADLVAASFPGGSITGAPKIRAMEIIDELEPVARGPYTGSLVHFGADGGAELSIVIRTALFEGGRAHVNVGGGIVADSTPDGEYVETLDKARAVVAAIRAAEGAAVAGTT